ncbi:hypothetical protein [Mesomycoplasma lagogenitalium]|uniref:Uncharacterized protein n=1 Tax=Mesomycoplasma lagogenitalium TaxID=171286 RepID=A0ABY8LVS9_9BACT|nr:hypothetical protein [Mesomycoplasma lagogenitalium]WGI36643.1 hypothetical protein QEG99_04230 [Mesomycoplasma lagogenitalium]
MWLLIVQIVIFFLWNTGSSAILFLRIKTPYKIFKKTHVWGKMERINLFPYNTYVFATLGYMMNVIYSLFHYGYFSQPINITITFFASLIYIISVVFYTLGIYVSYKIRQNPLWLYKEK